MVAEAPSRSGLGPLGVLDCDSGLRLAHLDPANAADFEGKATEPARTRRCIERTLGLFERVSLLAEHPGAGEVCSKEQLAAAWRALAPALEGRRVVLVGRAALGAKIDIPPLRWLRMGRNGEPAEVCRLVLYSSKFTNARAVNTDATSEWLAEVRRDREDAESAWVAIGGGWAYHLAHGAWLRVHSPGAVVAVGPDRADAAQIRDRLLEAATGIRRGGGFWSLSCLDHGLLVGDLSHDPGAKRLGYAHDLPETPIMSDVSTPLKRIMRREYRPVERVAARAVERLLGLDPTPEQREEVRQADRLALLVEARQVGVDLGDPAAEFGQDRADAARAGAIRRAARPARPADWLAAWVAAGG
jgi:hypothetical protein